MKNPTRHKIQEAEYFLLMIKQTFEDDDTFSYNLSAFLSTARSITCYMQKQYSHCNGFAEWYCPNKIKMSEDSGLKYFNKARVEDVHKKPVETSATRETTCDVANDFRMVKKNVHLDKQIKQTKPDLSAQGGKKQT